MTTYPHCLKSEQSIIGSLIIDPSYVEETLLIVDEQDFFSEYNKKIFSCIKNLFKKNIAIDMVTIPNEARKTTNNNEKEISIQLIDIMAETPSAVNLESYIKIVLEKSKQRKAIILAEEIKKNELLTSEEIENKFHNFLENSSRSEIKAVSTEEAGNTALLNVYKKCDGEVKLIPTTPIIDERMFGLSEGNIMTIGARPKTGKSAMGIKIALDSAKEGTKVLFITLEMSENEVIERMLANIARVPNFKIQKGLLNEKDMVKLPKAQDIISKLPIKVVSYPSMTTEQLHKLIKHEKRKGGVDLVIVDYLQLLKVKEAKSRYEAISSISIKTKAIALKEKVPIVCMAQLSRPSKGQENSKPTMGSFRDSGSIEQDADILCVMYAEEEADDSQDFVNEKDLVFSIIASRNSPTFSTAMVLECNYMNFKKPI